MFFSISISFSQNTNRYYPSLRNILNTQLGDRTIPNAFNYYHNWIEKTTYNMHYKNMQMSSSSRNDSRFYSFDLIVKKQNNFSLGNSGINIIFNENKTDFTYPIPLRVEETFKLNSYFSSYDLNNYNPENLKQQYELLYTILNLSEESLMANFLNIMIEPKNKKESSLDTFVDDLKKEADISLKSVNLEDVKLKDIVTEIYNQKKVYSSSILYDIYIKDKNPTIEEENLERYISSFIPEYYSDFLIDKVAYTSKVTIPDKNIALTFPQNLIQLVESEETKSNYSKIDKDIKLSPSVITVTNYITKDKKGIEFKLEHFTKSSDNLKFILPNEIKLNKSIILKEKDRTLTVRNSNDIKSITIFITDSKITVSMDYDDKKYMYESNLNFIDQAFDLNKM